MPETNQCRIETLELIHGTSLKRAKSIKKGGFMDTSKLPSKMREGWGLIGEKDLTFFILYDENFDEKRIRQNEVGVLFHALRVAKDDNSEPAIIFAHAEPKCFVEDKDYVAFKKELEQFAEKKVEKGDNRWFRTYSIFKFDDIFGAIGSVATENLSMGEIMREMGIDAIQDGENVIVLATPNETITHMEIWSPNKLGAWESFENSELAKKFYDKYPILT